MAVDLPTVVVVDEAPKSARSLATLRDAEARALGAWHAATGLRAVDLPEPAPITFIPVDADRPLRLARIERALHEARGVLDLGDAKIVGETRARLAVAYAEARAHPEDPEAPFLVGELLRTLARAEDLAGDAEGARALRARAEVLDGGRRIGLSEGGPLDAPAAATSPFVLTLLDAPTAVVPFVDGERREGALSLVAGEHHLRLVAADGRTLAAQWFFSGSAGLTLRLGSPRVACSATDLAPALEKLSTDAHASFAIACSAWLRVARRSTSITAPPPAASIEIQVCSAHDCGAPAVWSTVPLSPPPPRPESKSIFRSGWTWAAIGAAAVVGGTLTAWRLGAFDRDEPPPPTWRWEGAK